MQQERRTPLPLPDQTELSVLLYLSNYKSSAFKFKDYAINRIEILGSESKSASKTQRDLRRKVVNRINYLKGNLPNLIRLLRKKGLKKIFGQPIDQEPIQIQREEDFHEDLEEQNEILPSFDQLNLNDDEDNQQNAKPSTRKKKRTTTANMSSSEDPPRQIVVSTNDPTENEENISAVLTESVLVPDSISRKIPTKDSATAVSKLSLYYPVSDLQDYIDNRYTASLSEDGRKIIVQLPMCPNYMKTDMGRICKIFHPEAQESEMLAHGTVAGSASSLSTRTIEITINDDSQTFNNDYFNDGMNGLELFVDSKPLPIDFSWNNRSIFQSACLASFSVAIDGTERQVRLEGKRCDGPSLHDRAVDGYFGRSSNDCPKSSPQPPKPPAAKKSGPSPSPKRHSNAVSAALESCKPLEFLSSARTPTQQTRNTAADNRYKNKNTNSKNSPAPTALEFLSSARRPTRSTSNTAAESSSDNSDYGLMGSACFNDEDDEDAPVQIKRPSRLNNQGLFSSQQQEPSINSVNNVKPKEAYEAIPLQQPSNKSVVQHESKSDNQSIVPERRIFKGTRPIKRFASHKAQKNTESGTAPVFDFGSPQSTLQTFSIRKSVGIETRIIDTPLSTRDGGTTDPVTSSHLEEDSDVSDIQVGLDSLSIVAGKKDVEDMRNKLETKKKAAEDRKNIHARMIAKKIARTNTLRENLEEARKQARSRNARYLIRNQKEALEDANKEVDSLSADYDTAARIEDSELDEEHAILMKKMGELENQEALEKSDDIVPSEEKAKSTALLPVRRDLRVDAGALSYNMEFRQDFIYKHNLAYLKCKNNHNGDDCVTFFVPMNLALGSAGAEEFYPANYTISGDRSFKSLLKDQRVATIGTTTLHFFEEDLEPKVTISGGEGVAKIVLSFHSKSDNARVHLIDRVLEEDGSEITDEETLSSIGTTIATETTFGYSSASQKIIGSYSQEFLTSSRLAAMSPMSICSNKKDMSNPLNTAAAAREKTEMSSMSICSNKKDNSNLLTVAAAKTEDNRDNMSFTTTFTKDANNVATACSTGLEEINEAMSLTSLQDTKKYDISVLPESIKQKETLPDGGANTNHQQPQQQAIVLRFRNKQGDDLPTGFYHDHQGKFSIGQCGLDERAAKRFLHLNPDRTYSRHAMKAAYKDRILQTHPDHRKGCVLKEDRERSDEEFRNVRAAWKILDRDDKINRPIPATPRASYDTDTQYANDLKKNLESFVTLEKFLAQLSKLTSARYAAFMEEPPFQLSASQLASYRQRNLTIQRNALEAGLAKVEIRAPIQSLHGVEIDITDAVIWKNSERFSIRSSIEKLRRSPASGNEQLAIADPTTRAAFIMQSHYENKSTFPLLLSGEKDQALIVAESTNQKRKADNLAQHDNDTFKIAPSAGKKKRQRRDNLEINMNNTDASKNYTRTRSGRRSRPN